MHRFKTTGWVLAFLAFTNAGAAQSPVPQTNPYYTDERSYMAQHHALQDITAPPLTDSHEDTYEYPFPTPSSYYREKQPPKERNQYKTPSPDIPISSPPIATAPSTLESVYARRIVDELEQYGYDMFGLSAQSQSSQGLYGNTAPPMGAVQDDFMLQTGDELDITFTGQRTDRAIHRITSSGTLLIEDFPPIPAAGRTIGQLRLSVQAAADNLYNTQAYISLASVRQIGILVVGNVKRPGRQNLTVFHSVIDALMESGGIDKTGSLRQIKLVRDGRSTIVDLYALLMHGSAGIDLSLRDGDRIIVPSIGPTVAVAGEVKRPGIFELQPVMNGMLYRPEDNAQKLSLNDMLELGGGVLSPGKNRYLKMEISPSGVESVEEVENVFDPIFGDGSILMVSKGDEKREGTIEIMGHTRRPGMHALSENKTLSSLISSPDILGPDIYPLIGVIERWNSLQLSHELISFPPKLVLEGSFDRQLEDGDIIHIFSNKQIKSLYTKPDTIKMQNVSYGSSDDPETEQVIGDTAIESFLKERSVFVKGAIRNEGSYPVAEGTTLENIIATSGGFALEANTSNIEITSALQGQGHQQGGRSGTQRQTINIRETSPSNVPIGPGDSVRVNQKFKKIAEKSVVISGEVTNPGSYDLIPGDKLSDLLSRAGGLTPQAYADGAIFSRASERKAEESRFKTQARAMKQAIAAALEKDDEKINPAQIAEARALAKELEMAEGIGRITVTASPEMLAMKPELDMLLEPGDRLFIPKRNLTVRVSGEILSPAALQFRESKKPLDYIHEAGGFSFNADKDRTFVLYPDGSAQPLQISSWNYNPIFIPPGSTIVVPRDPKPFDFIESAKDVSQILSNLAITAIFIDDVRNDD